LGKKPPKAKDASPELELENPLSIASAVKFAAVFAVVSLASKLALVTIGAQGAFVAAVLSGVADVDAITLSLSRLHAAGDLDGGIATLAIGVAAATNSLVKVGIATVVGGTALGRQVGLALGAALVAAIPFYFFVV
jgi:uncharacterized membrane protein (DUF4010 family)